MAGMVGPTLTLTRDRATKTVRAVATCRINFNDFELVAMEQGAHFRLRAKLFGADPGGADDLFTFNPHKIYPDATPGDVEDATFEETLGEEVLDEDFGVAVDEIFATFELFSQVTGGVVVQRSSPTVTARA